MIPGWHGDPQLFWEPVVRTRSALSDRHAAAPPRPAAGTEITAFCGAILTVNTDAARCDQTRPQVTCPTCADHAWALRGNPAREPQNERSRTERTPPIRKR
ncbi:hypothetical protein [Actinoalloteichus hymeniacidonis]|uniref:Uncharacterized protein n=1 Tax=Actinoalloteichus hymeniacidonis TaxID=340345 RepID=A0AAC9HU69_9PSEU|nr:hypothetical protein [Actinoalloteichus hymeniacidonis]AOS64971.1 hypothetical protein TL08_20900 [Actinoalloteichus hymeniacidonis]MBB5906954.1 hypothetical protein [Actinoalloteichus hymeniacidonis]